MSKIGYSPFGRGRPITGPARQIQGYLLMKVSLTQPNQHTCVIGFSGKLDFQSRHAFQGAMVQTEQASTRHIILDFTDISHIDSAGLGLLCLAHKKLSAMGSRMVIANAQNVVRDILLLTNMDNIFPLYDSVAAASQHTRTMMIQN